MPLAGGVSARCGWEGDLADCARRSREPIPLYPLALALYPGLVLAEANEAWMEPAVLVPVLAVPVAIALLAMVLIERRARSRALAGAVLAIGLILCFTYGHAAMLVGVWVEPIHWLPFLWIGLLLVGIRAVREHMGAIQRLTRGLNVIAIALLMMPVASLVSAGPSEQDGPADLIAPALPIEPDGRLDAAAPDVYYIVLDGYARADTLLRIYGYDNSAFVADLEGRGFVVDPSSFANYDQTILSLPATLNLNYLQTMGADRAGGFDFASLVDLTRDNVASRSLRRAGYELVAFQSEHPASRLVAPDVFLEPPGALSELRRVGERDILGGLPAADRLFIETTALRPVVRLYERTRPEHPRISARRELIEYVFSHLPDAAVQPGPQFTFAHILAPHPPFVFPADGSVRRTFGPYTIVDASHWMGRLGTRRDYIEGYRGQVVYVNQRVREAVEGVLARSTTPPIIVIQGDHGPGAFFEWSSSSDSDLSERMGILTAVYLPPGTASETSLYPGMSPVNTFRLVLNAALGADLPLLPDRAYFSPWESPFDFSDVTAEVSGG